MSLFRKFIENLLAFLASFMLASGVFLAFINVFVRFVFNQSIEWAFELTSYLFIYSTFFAAAYLFSKGANIKVTILLDIVPDKISKIMVILVDLLNIVYLGIIAYFSYVFIFDPDLGVKASGEVSVDLGVKMWIVYLILPISAVLGVIVVLFKLKDDFFTPADKIRKKVENEIIEEEIEEMKAGIK